MRYRFPSMLSLVVLGFFAVYGTAAENIITPMEYSLPPVGGGASPKSPHETIRLESQEVTIRLKPSHCTVDAVFHLFNNGEATTDWVGFPKRWFGGFNHFRDLSGFISFEVSVNGRKIPVKEEPDFKSDALELPKRRQASPGTTSSWLVGKALFPSRSETTIRVRYQTHYQHCDSSCDRPVYIFGTGRHWKATIGKAAFIIDATEIGGVERTVPKFWRIAIDSPRKRVISENLVRYEVRDFEPNAGGMLSIAFRERPSPGHYTHALKLAAMNGRLTEVQELLKKGADVNDAGGDGPTPLMHAAWAGSMPVVKLLVEKGADVNAVRKCGESRLEVYEEGRLKKVITFRKECGETALQRALSKSLEVATFLKKRGAKATTLSAAAFVGDMEAVRRFIKDGADLSPKKTSDAPAPLMAAAMGGESEVVKLLLELGVNIEAENRSGYTPLIAAAGGGHVEVIELLLDRGAHIHARNNWPRSTALKVATAWGHAEAVKVLLERGAEIDARDHPEGRTPLMHAAQRGHLRVVKILLEKGANVNATDKDGRTALSLAREWRRGKKMEELEQLLVTHGARE